MSGIELAEKLESLADEIEAEHPEASSVLYCLAGVMQMDNTGVKRALLSHVGFFSVKMIDAIDAKRLQASN